MHLAWAVSWLLLASGDPAAIMATVVANLDHAADLRGQFVYRQLVTTSLIRGNGQLSRREKRQYEAFPGEKRTEKKLVSLDGECRRGKITVHYTEPGYKDKGLDIDGDLIRDMTESLVDDKSTRDGIPPSLFPLRRKDLPGYRFTRTGEFDYQGRRTYKIQFEPADRHRCINIGGDDDDCQGPSWAGEAWIDAQELQPARIFTTQAFRIPWGVKVFLGTNIQQSGFAVSYQRLEQNVWFPAGYGTEFRFNALWGYRRTVTLSLESNEFRRTGATSKIDYTPARQQKKASPQARLFRILPKKRLFSFARALLAIPLARQGFLGTLLLAGLQVERVTLDLLDNIFLLHLALKAAQRAFKGLAVLDVDFSQKKLTSLSNH
jgi:hypothetical protein